MVKNYCCCLQKHKKEKLDDSAKIDDKLGQI